MSELKSNHADLGRKFCRALLRCAEMVRFDEPIARSTFVARTSNACTFVSNWGTKFKRTFAPSASGEKSSDCWESRGDIPGT